MSDHHIVRTALKFLIGNENQLSNRTYFAFMPTVAVCFNIARAESGEEGSAFFQYLNPIVLLSIDVFARFGKSLIAELKRLKATG